MSGGRFNLFIWFCKKVWLKVLGHWFPTLLSGKNIMMETRMNLASFLANNCFEYLLGPDHDQENESYLICSQQKSSNNSAFHVSFSALKNIAAELPGRIYRGGGACFGSYPVNAIAAENNINKLNSN
jgi:hypothetical protein